MNSAVDVDKKVQEFKDSGMNLNDAAWKTALLCVGWPYVFAGNGQYCTPANRRSFYRASHPTIKTKCKNYDGKKSCDGCKWYPKGEKVRFFDCRGFTYWILYKVYGWKMLGGGATTQWNNSKNWKEKGTIKNIPNDKLVCLFQQNTLNKSKMKHTGLGYRGETIECQVGVQHSKKRNSKWTHWAVPNCEVKPDPQPTPPTPPTPVKKPTIKRGSKGKYVTECQKDLIKLGYDVGKTGADGKFGANTVKAVKAFQKEHKDSDGKKLKVDGIVGERTWAALDKAVS